MLNGFIFDHFLVLFVSLKYYAIWNNTDYKFYFIMEETTF
jgi:hypothetical protein